MKNRSSEREERVPHTEPFPALKAERLRSNQTVRAAPRTHPPRCLGLSNRAVRQEHSTEVTAGRANPEV